MNQLLKLLYFHTANLAPITIYKWKGDYDKNEEARLEELRPVHGRSRWFTAKVIGPIEIHVIIQDFILRRIYEIFILIRNKNVFLASSYRKR